MLALALLIASCGSAAGDPCDAEPVGSVNVFFVGQSASRDVVATVASITPLDELEGFRYDMTDGARLTWLAKEPMGNVKAGGTYRFGVNYRPGFPDASSVLVYEGDRLTFAAVTDLETEVPGLLITPGEATCPSRGRTKCHKALVNRPLIVEGRPFHHGDTARAGGFEVRVLMAQKITYDSRCADAGRPGISFTVTRVE